jgi:hypothetical protein
MLRRTSDSTLLMQLVRGRFAEPMSIANLEWFPPGSYCVVGALLRYLEEERCGWKLSRLPWFPSVRDAHEALTELGVSVEVSRLRKVMQLNDEEHFNEAWAELEEALSYEET